MNEKENIFARLTTAFSRLSFRERLFLLAGAVFVLATTIYLIASSGSSNKPAEKTRADTLLQNQKLFAQTLEKYLAIKPLVDKIEGRLNSTPEDFDLYKEVNRLIQQIGIREQVVKMDPGTGGGNDYLKEEYVDLNLQKMKLQPLINFLQKLESLPAMVRVDQLSIKRRLGANKTLDVIMRVSVYKKQEGAR